MPEYEEVLCILKSEKSNLNLWVDLALAYYKNGNPNALIRLLEMSRSNASLEYKDSDKDQMRALDMLGTYYVQTATQEKDKGKRRELHIKATHLYSTADKIMMYDTNHVLCRAFFCLAEGNKIEQADAQFNFVLNQSVNNVPAQLGKANIAYNRKEYKEALTYYKKALRINPQCPADVRLGMAHCFLKLGNEEKARLAFERALKLDSKCVGALVGLAIIKLNGENPGNIKLGTTMLSKAYNIDPNNPMVLNHLANHFFFKKEYAKTKLLAERALLNTENEAMRAESCYHMARVFHVQADNQKAFQYYYQATQFASTTFVLPHYGLGQMYIHGGDMENAVQCFEKVLRAQPNNYESMKILSSLYASSNNQQKREIAKSHLMKITERFPEDIEAWIELAQILEQSDLCGSLSAYDKALDLIHKSGQCIIPPVLLNNVAALNFRLGNLDESRTKLEESLTASKEMILANPTEHESCISITITYNLARLLEAQCQFQKAKTLYKDILKEHPNYIDCYLRLGCMARDRNQIYEASDWFKEALRIDNEHPNAWTLLGNLHFSKMEWGPSQKKFERILRNPSTINDPYALISMGNIWMQTLYQPTSDRDKKMKNLELALQFYSKVLKSDPKNIWAANGIGCVVAHKNYIAEAKDIFAQVRESTDDFCDVWLNIAHIYTEQKQYINAIQMYENCMKKFFKHDNIEVLQYLGRAYIKAGKFTEAKFTYLKAQRVAPQNPVILYNIAFVLKLLASKILKDEKSNLNDVLQAVNNLELSHRYFLHLSNTGDRMRYDVTTAGLEATRCQDLLSQAQYHVARARKMDNEERETRLKQEIEREATRVKHAEEHNKTLKQLEKQKEQMLLKRQEIIEKTKIAKILLEPVREKRKIKRHTNNAPDSDESVSSDPDDNRSSRSSEPNKSIKSGKDKEDKKNKPTKRPRESLASSKSGSDRPANKKPRSLKIKEKVNMLPSKQKMRIVSKAIISTSENDSSDSDVKKRIMGQYTSRTKSGSPISKSSSSKSDFRRSGPKSRSASGSCLKSNSRSDNRSQSSSRSSS
ncbi:Tetratricopeptide repeat,Tetratricopeptide repeat-containing domain,Sel1-like [Cinara cedri]|uniref:Tetratricopeptide repeat,Tetratricopeptide repeat-containing domain,Sel1-like n=1 Tax=Cinara cedri TaxID=506608 RepID=A0A5E4MZ98_9HEMI|nr:Tetratricopeptide repeat,Tetratricopeptide repeat-containing domain,Sel1-like [Cinara cedri]